MTSVFARPASVIVGIAIGFILAKSAFVMSAGPAAEPEALSLDVLMKAASTLNKRLPMTVDSETELLTTVALPRTFVYQYRVTNLDSDQLTVGAVRQFERTQRAKVTNMACTMPETRDRFLRMGVTMRYQYSDKSGHHISSFEVRLSDCATK